MRTRCKLCAASRERVFSAQVLNRYEVDYFYCDQCGLLQTEEPFWLDEAYASAIADADTGLVRRNLSIARRLSAVLYFCFDRKGRYLDAAGGHGLLARLMRDVGFNFFWHDPYCENLFARGFERGRTRPPMDAITAFEVLEHLPDPFPFVKDLLAENDCRTLIFSTELFTGSPPDPEAWWYYTPTTGQHVSFYQKRTLEQLGQKLSLRLYSNRGIHMLTDRPVNGMLFNFLTAMGSWMGHGWARVRMRSLTFSDHEHIVGAGKTRAD
ncbi:MAG: class I SAM-dependent methyltransferase [Planctomycetota bacterium]